MLIFLLYSNTAAHVVTAFVLDAVQWKLLVQNLEQPVGNTSFTYQFVHKIVKIRFADDVIELLVIKSSSFDQIYTV